MKEAWIKVARHMEEVNISIKFISEKFEEMEKDRKEKKRQISELKNEIKILNEKIETLGRSFDSKLLIEMKSGQETYGFKNVWLQDGKIL